MKTLIYCGPDLPKVPLKENQVMLFKKGFTENIKAEIEKCPEIEKLFIKAEDFADFQNKKRVQGNRENSLYKKVQAYKG